MNPNYILISTLYFIFWLINIILNLAFSQIINFGNLGFFYGLGLIYTLVAFFFLKLLSNKNFDSLGILFIGISILKLALVFIGYHFYCNGTISKVNTLVTALAFHFTDTYFATKFISKQLK
jgi:hypothetical protein